MKKPVYFVSKKPQLHVDFYVRKKVIHLWPDIVIALMEGKVKTKAEAWAMFKDRLKCTSFEKFKSRVGVLKWEEVAKSASGNASIAAAKENGRAIVESFLAIRREGQLNHLNEMTSIVDKSRGILAKKEPTEETLNHYIKTAQSISTLGKDVYGDIDKQTQGNKAPPTNNLAILVAINQKESNGEQPARGTEIIDV